VRPQLPTIFPSSDDEFTTPSQPTTTVLASAGDSNRNHVQHHQDLGDAVDALERNVALLTHDHSAGTGRRATRQLVQANTHNDADTDKGPLAIHHTLGPRGENAAPGDHTHPEGTPYVPPVAEWINMVPGLYSGGPISINGPGYIQGDYSGRYPVSLGPGGWSEGRYIVVGHQLTFTYLFKWGNPPYNGGTQAIYSFLPRNFISTRAGEDHIFAKLFTAPRTGPIAWPAWTGQNWIGDAYLPPNSNLVTFAFPWGTNNCSLADYVIAQRGGIPGEGVPHIPGGFAEGGNLYCWGSLEIQNPPPQ
jgi:hypothetical protein